MKTATYQYTHKTEVDSSLAQAVYYNAENQTMAIEFNTNGHQVTGSAIYGQVPQAFYEGFVTVSSIGKTYNEYVKVTFPNLSEGTVYDVQYSNGLVKKPEQNGTFRYHVKGYIRHSGNFVADTLDDARKMFFDSLLDEGYDVDDLAVTEVEIVGAGS